MLDGAIYVCGGSRRFCDVGTDWLLRIYPHAAPRDIERIKHLLLSLLSSFMPPPLIGICIEYCRSPSAWQVLEPMSIVYEHKGMALIDNERLILSHYEHDRKVRYQCFSNESWRWSIVLPSVDYLHVTLNCNGILYVLDGIHAEPRCRIYNTRDELRGDWYAAPAPHYWYGENSQGIECNGKLYVFGDYCKTNECFDPIKQQWTIISPIPDDQHRIDVALVTIPHPRASAIDAGDNTNMVAVMGGSRSTERDAKYYYDTTMLYDPLADKWALAYDRRWKLPNGARRKFFAKRIHRTIFIGGGYGQHPTLPTKHCALSSCWAFDLDVLCWTPFPSLPYSLPVNAYA